jgi:hypothetical protein
MVIGGYSINGCWWLFYKWLLVIILLMDIGGYCINGYWWLLVAILLLTVSGYW